MSDTPTTADYVRSFGSLIVSLLVGGILFTQGVRLARSETAPTEVVVLGVLSIGVALAVWYWGVSQFLVPGAEIDD